MSARHSSLYLYLDYMLDGSCRMLECEVLLPFCMMRLLFGPLTDETRLTGLARAQL